jgi:hypothetical protein
MDPYLSIVMVVHDMPREAARTLRSLTPPYQADVAVSDFEILIVDNASSKPLEQQEIVGLSSNVRYFDFDSGNDSPAGAVNFGVSQAHGHLLGILIDGARMASPRLLAQAMRASRLHPRPLVACLAWHLGPDVQWESRMSGYNQGVEDDLLERTRWWEDGYRLFSIASLAGSSAGGWFAPMAESNSLFLSREMWTELGGFDLHFNEPGGGYGNLDFYRRACELPNTELIVLLGEGTFHQFHGGIATNATPDELAERGKAWAAHYRELRGSDYRVPDRRPLYFGRIPEAAMKWVAPASKPDHSSEASG